MTLDDTGIEVTSIPASGPTVSIVFIVDETG